MTEAPAIRAVSAAAVPEPPPGLFSNCLVVGDTIYISGQHAGTTNGVVGGSSVTGQTREALVRIVALVEAAGGTADDIVKLNVYLVDMSRRAEVSAARRELFSEPMPCSTLVGINALVSPDLLVEIDATAVIGADRRRAGKPSERTA